MLACIRSRPQGTWSCRGGSSCGRGSSSNSWKRKTNKWFWVPITNGAISTTKKKRFNPNLTASSTFLWPAATFSAYLLQLKPKRVMRSPALEPSEPVVRKKTFLKQKVWIAKLYPTTFSHFLKWLYKSHEIFANQRFVYNLRSFCDFLNPWKTTLVLAIFCKTYKHNLAIFLAFAIWHTEKKWLGNCFNQKCQCAIDRCGKYFPPILLVYFHFREIRLVRCLIHFCVFQYKLEPLRSREA